MKRLYIKRLYILIIVILAFLICLGYNSTRAIVWENEVDKQAYCSNNLLRLHIQASSSSPEDQYLKRQIRDLILTETKHFFKKVDDHEKAVKVAEYNIPDLQWKIENFLQSQGKNIPIELKLGRFEFPTRTYGDLTLPQGKYQALQIIIGNGEGNNWWCVLFPPLCLDNEESENVDENMFLKLAFAKDDEDFQVEYRFKFLEVLSDIPEWIKADYLDILRITLLGSNGILSGVK
ncbi:MAG: stage II sporulation protein R [Desulfobacterales bacterium]|nr:stage II sporulation protein R [Desulfobacterales bacterium]